MIYTGSILSFLQDLATQAVQDANGKSIEEARDTISRLLSKKMQEENQHLHHVAAYGKYVVTNLFDHWYTLVKFLSLIIGMYLFSAFVIKLF